MASLMILLSALAPNSDPLREAVIANARQFGGVHTVCRFRLQIGVPDISNQRNPYGMRYGPSGRPGKPPAFFPSFVESTAYVGAKFRNSIEFTNPDTKQPLFEHKAYDGTGSSNWIQEGRTLNRSKGASVVKAPTQDWYGEAVGFGRAAARSIFLDFPGAHRIDEVIGSSRYHRIGHGDSSSGNGTVEFVCDELDRAVLAIDKAYALVEREIRWSFRGSRRMHIVNSDFREVSPQFWLPFQTKIEVFGDPSTKPDKICISYIGIIEKLDLAPSPELFDFSAELPVGTFVRDMVRSEEYLLGREKNGSVVKHPIQGAGTTKAQHLMPVAPPIASLVLGSPWFWSSLGTLSLAAAVFLARKYRRA